AVSGTLLLAVDVDTPGAALGQDTTTVDFLSTTDGLAWTMTAGGTAFADQAVRAVASATPSGPLVAVGGPGPGRSPLATGAGGAAAWTSPDGVTWAAAKSSSRGFGSRSSAPESA